MRKSREEAARTRERIIAAAAEEFREHGVVATGLADLMKAAGLTHGGFYKHFASKEELVREVTAATIDQTTSLIRQAGAKRPGRKGLVDAVSTYLSPEHRDNPGQGCALAALGPELGRGDAKTRAEATQGFLKLVDVLAEHAEGMRPDEARKRAIAAAATMIGAMTMARMVKHPDLSNEILKSSADLAVRSFEGHAH
jgi:TetR/AcrR family transcriptional regulator, transcriptional repressor for nem operon